MVEYNVINRADENSTPIIENHIPLTLEEAKKLARTLFKRRPGRFITIEENEIDD
jgi:hypothetical protein